MKFKYWLTSLTDISNAKKKLLHDCSITAEKLFFMPKNELFDILFFTDDDRKIILESRASYDVEKEWILFQQKDIGFVTMEDEAYPDKLRNIHNPPYSLFYIGALPDKSRKKCRYSRSTGQKRIWLRGGKGTGSSTFKAGNTDNQRHGKRNRQRCPYGVSGGWWKYICSSWLRSRHLLSEREPLSI